MTMKVKEPEMETSLMAHIRQTAKDDVRLFFAPFVGAAKAVKEELNRIHARKSAAKNKAARH
jgi:hypothetical protein